MQTHVKVRDVVLAMTSSTMSTPSRGIFRELSFAPCADFGLLQAAHAAAAGQGAATCMWAASIRRTCSMTNAPT
jgi:purine-nucleoside phosphorylase